MTFEEIQEIIVKDEHRCLELKKTTGELQDGMHSACAFLNTEGGWLIFGVTPKSLKMLGQQVSDDTQREIAQALAGLYPAVEVKPEYIDVPERPGAQLIAMHFCGWKWGQMPYTYHGCPYYKVESTTKVMSQEMYQERLRAAKPEVFAWERQVADGMTLADLNEERIRGAVRLGVERGRMPATAEVESLESLLGKWGLMHDSKVLNGAVALFGAQTGSYTQMRLRLARFRGTNKNEFMDSSRADGNFFDLLDAGMAFLFKHLSLSGKIVGFRKEEQLEIPAEALREALTNALCHRQLEKYNLSPGIAVYDDRVEIENPGRFPLGVTPENIKTSHASFPYNPLIAEVLYRSSFLESWGSGVGRMVDACRAQGVPEPEYELMEGFVKMIFRKSFAASGQSRDKVGTKSGQSREQAGSKLSLSSHQVVTKLSLSSHQVVTKLSLSIPMIGDLLKKMVEPMPAKEMRDFCGQKDATYFKANVIDPLIAEGLVAMTQPNSPKSPTQKYYLTEFGKTLVEE